MDAALHPAADPSAWPCGHPRTEKNTKNIGASGVRCRECRRRIERRSAAKKAGRPYLTSRHEDPKVNVGQAREVIADVAARHGVTSDQILSETRVTKVMAARHEIFSILHGMGASFMSIGRLMDRHHSTVMHGIAQHRAAHAPGHATPETPIEGIDQ